MLRPDTVQLMMFPPLVSDQRFRLALVIAGIVPSFALTLMLVGRYNDQRTALARQWAERGEDAIASNPHAAVLDFQTALAYGPDETTTRLRLAEALMAAREHAEAQAHLLTLWAAAPGDGRLNLDLARLAGASGDVPTATRYYHAAIDGAWDHGAANARRAARIELATLLLQHQQPDRAQGELIALTNDLPPDPALITEVGRLLVQAGAEARSIGLFERALALDPQSALAPKLEGEVQFRAGRYQAASRLLATAKRHGASLDQTDEMMLESSARVFVLDPLAARLTARQRLDRALQDLGVARVRIARCASPALQASDAARVTDLSSQAESFQKMPRRRLERDPDQVSALINLGVEIEALPAQMCGPDTPDDRALQLMAGLHRQQPR